jgi:putative transposase
MKFLLERNQRVQILGETWVLLRKREGDIWILENLSNGRIAERSRKELITLSENKELVPVFDQDDRPTKLTTIDIPESAQRTIDLRMEYVRAVDGLAISQDTYEVVMEEVWKRINKRAEAIGPRNSPYTKKLRKRWNWVTVYRWYVRYRRLQRDSHALLHRKRIRRLNLHARLHEILEDAIDEVYLIRERGTVRDTLDCAQEKVREENEKRARDGLKPLLKPSFRMLQRVRDTIPAFDQYAARYGRQAAIVKFRSIKGHVITSAPLERVEIDHTPLDLFVVDDINGLPLGRPFLTVCIDDHTRCVLGFYIGFVDPSCHSVAICLKNAFRQNDWISEMYPNIEHVDEIYGVPTTIVVDQGLEFYAGRFVKACDRLGITVLYSARKTPWHKAKIENFLGKANREIAHKAPGTTFNNIFAKGDYDPEKHAVVRLSILKRIVYRWIYDVYHQRQHRSLGITPAEMWAKTINYDDIPLPADSDALNVILGKEEDRVLTTKGIEYEGLKYNSNDLEALRRQYGFRLEVTISVDESNIGSIYVIYGDHCIKVPALKSPYAEGISLWQHKKFKAFAEKSNPDGWMKAKEEIRLEIRQELGITKPKSSKQKGKRRRKLGRLTEGLSPELQQVSAEVKPYKKQQERSKKQHIPVTIIPAVPTVSVVPTYAPIYQTRTLQPDSNDSHPPSTAE